jgi:hypothetical protein
VTLSPQLFGDRDRLQMNLTVGGGGEVTLRTSGPSDKSTPEQLSRGLHRMAFNAIAHADGASRMSEFGHLRDYVLTGYHAMRAYLLDEESLNESLRSTERWTASYELFRDPDGRPQVALLRLGMLFFYVSVEPTTTPLHAMRRKFSWLRLAGEIDE